jgi:hypothetical protein
MHMTERGGRSAKWRGLEVLESRVLLSGDVLTNHNGGANLGDYQETILTPTSIASSQAGSSISTNFGRTFSTTLDGNVFAHVLAKSNVNITRGTSQGIHNVLYVATMNDSLYAVDAGTGAILWQDNFTQLVDPRVTSVVSPTAGVTTEPGTAVSNNFPEIGILSTPVIDPATGILYLLSVTQEVRSGVNHYVQRLWAVNTTDGSVAVTPTNQANEPASNGMVVGDVIYTSSNFSLFSGYQYVAGPYIKGSGQNGVNDATPMDGWAVNAGDTISPWGIAGKTPSTAGYIAFNPLVQMNREALTLVNGVVLIGLASHADVGPYYGWIIGYNASNLANSVAFVTAPTYEPFSIVSGNNGNLDSQAGLWNSGNPFTTDGTYIYISTGNGAFNDLSSNFNNSYTSSNMGNIVQLPLDNDYGDVVLKLVIDPNANQSHIDALNGINRNPNGTYDPDGGYNANGVGLKVIDFFAPSNTFELNVIDADLGSAAVTLIPSVGPDAITAPNGDPVLVTGGKEGRLYLLDADNLGGYNTQFVVDGHERQTNADPAPYDRALGEFYYAEFLTPTTLANSSGFKIYGSPSYLNGEVYASFQSKPVLGFSVANLFWNSPVHSAVQTSPNFQTTETYGGVGATMSISSNGTSDAILWNLSAGSGSTNTLQAHDVAGNTLFTSSWKLPGQSTNATDALGSGTKFTLPTVYNSMVYADTAAGVLGYGLLNPVLSTPTVPTATGELPSVMHVAWALQPSDQESGILIERSTDNIHWTTIHYADTGQTSYDDTGLTPGTNYFYRMTEIYSSKKSAVSASVEGTTLLPFTITKRQLFYKDSSFDVGGHDNAIAPDKSALLPGGTATLANYSSYDKGINGIMVDVSGSLSAISAADFVFKVGNDNSLADWSTLTAISTLNLRAIAGGTRIEITFADGSITKQWLQVTVLADPATGLASADTFYFGNAVGEAGDSSADAKVNAIDELAARAGVTASAALNNLYDFNRDGKVDAADQLIARSNATMFLNALTLITPPLAGGSPAIAAAPAGLTSDAHASLIAPLPASPVMVPVPILCLPASVTTADPKVSATASLIAIPAAGHGRESAVFSFMRQRETIWRSPTTKLPSFSIKRVTLTTLSTLQP